MTEPDLRDLPLRALRQCGYYVRRVAFTGTHDGPVCPTTDALATVRVTLGTASYTLSWPFSYHYKGEDVNAARYYHDPTRRYSHRQLHVRGFVTETGVELTAHEEPSAIHHPRAHLDDRAEDATAWIGRSYSAYREGRPDALDPENYTRP
jgi:hypothetical protein